MIAFALALVAHRRGWLDDARSSLVTGLLYTIPSLALFQLLCRSPASSRTTAEIALVSYTLLILFRNIARRACAACRPRCATRRAAWG